MDRNELVERLRLTPKEMLPHWKWAYDKAGSPRQEFNIENLIEAQLNKVMNDPDIVEGLKLLQQVRQGTTIEAIIIKRRKRPDMILADD